MSTKVSITKEKLDNLANAIADKSGESIPMTIDGMISAVNGISGGGYDKELIEGSLSVNYENSEVTSIRSHCFYYASFPSSVKMSFENCLSIGSYAFAYTNNITELNFPNCTLINYNAFNTCTNLSSLNVSKVITFNGTISNCYSLKELYLPSATTFAGATACSALESVYVPNVSGSVAPTFNNCRALSSLVMPSTFTTVNQNCFNDCSALSSINLPYLSKINGNAAFARCGIIEVSFPSLTSFSDASRPCSYVFESCKSLVTVFLPNFQGVIGSSTFRHCTSLETVYMPGVSSMHADVFGYCTALKSIYFPSLTGAIGMNAFVQCSSMSTAVLGNVSTNTISIMAYAFSGCYNLKSVYILDGPNFYFSSSVFQYCSRLVGLYLFKSSAIFGAPNSSIFFCTPLNKNTAYTSGVIGSIYVPASLYASYVAAAGWAYYSSQFVSLTDAEIEDIITEITPVIPSN